MNVLVTNAVRYCATPDGRLWTRNPALGYSFWARYLDVFEEVRLLARALPAACRPEGSVQVTGPGLVPVRVPFYDGPFGLAAAYQAVSRALRAALSDAEAVAVRAPCAVGSLAGRLLEPARPYSLEVVGDPEEVYAPGVSRHPLRPLLRCLGGRELRHLAGRAAGAAYVNRTVLPHRYPAPATAFTTHFSSVELPPEAFASAPRPPLQRQAPLRLITVGTMAQPYKGHQVLLQALARCRRLARRELHLTLVGDGRLRPALEATSRRLGLERCVQFGGRLASRLEVRAALDQADLFVLPSLTEGLPRAMLEAMARGLPCVGSSVGGIPELLQPPQMAPPGDHQALAAIILRLADDPGEYAALSARNLATAESYCEAALRARRTEFYRQLRDVTSRWLTARRSE